MNIRLEIDNLKGFVDEKDFKDIWPKLKKAHESLEGRTGKGAKLTGWMDLPKRTSDDLLDEIQEFGKKVRNSSEAIISVGIGGSYLGVRASLEFLIADQKTPIYFAGNNLSSGYLYYLMKMLKDKSVSVIVISKSGTTTEPSLAFRIIRKFMHEKYDSEEIKKRIICITDKEKGALRKLATEQGYKTFPIDESVGGRFSVLTPVGLVPLAIAGIDIKELIKGAREAQEEFCELSLDDNMAYQYAAARYILYEKGKIIEAMSTFYQRLSYIGEWWKQLFGESEGKDGKSIYPTSLSFTTDLHSMGQLIQEGERNLFETFLVVEKPGIELIIPKEDDNFDGFNCVAGKDLDFVNKQAHLATAMAHYDGGVPNMTIKIDECSARTLGQIYYFFQRAVAITGYLLDVNPFNQPGVEAYKKNMFKLLGRDA